MSIAIIGTIVGIIVGVITIGAFVRKLFRTLNVLTEGVMGKAAVKDVSGAEIEPAIPSLQARVRKIEELVINTSDYSERLTALEEWKIQHQHYTDNVVQRMIEHMDRHSD